MLYSLAPATSSVTVIENVHDSALRLLLRLDYVVYLIGYQRTICFHGHKLLQTRFRFIMLVRCQYPSRIVYVVTVPASQRYPHHLSCSPGLIPTRLTLTRQQDAVRSGSAQFCKSANHELNGRSATSYQALGSFCTTTPRCKEPRAGSLLQCRTAGCMRDANAMSRHVSASMAIEGLLYKSSS